jgi:ubiquinone/menaquinone biosynthesis C-methylase UbiE
MTFDYSNASELRIRRSLYDRFSTRTNNWNSWIVADIRSGAKPLAVLDVGAGYGSVWSDHEDRDRLHVVLSDLSPGMLRDAPAHLPRVAMNVESLAIRSGTFDAVTAFSVFYHVERRDAAFGEITRVLRPPGVFVFTTTGCNHLIEIKQIIQQHAADVTQELTATQLPLEMAEEEARNYFEDVSVDVFPESLVVNDAEAILQYIDTTPAGRALTAKERELIERALRVRCSTRNGFVISTELGKIVSKGVKRGLS